MKTIWIKKKFPWLKKRTLYNFIEWYENLGGREILPPEEEWLKNKFSE